MGEAQTRSRTHIVGILCIAGLLALFEMFVAYFGAGADLRFAALAAFALIVLGNEAYRRLARR